MQLSKINFIAYKSLVNTEIEINHQCIGFVGKNECGKSNILKAISLLSAENEMTAKDTPKMTKSMEPQIVFTFKLSDVEKKNLKNEVNDWMCWNNNIAISENLFQDCEITYIIKFNKESNEEERKFMLNGLNLPKSIFIPIMEYELDPSTIINKEFEPFSIDQINVIDEEVLNYNSDIQEMCKSKVVDFERDDFLENEIEKLRKEINELIAKITNGVYLIDDEEKEYTPEQIEQFKNQKNDLEIKITPLLKEKQNLEKTFNYNNYDLRKFYPKESVENLNLKINTSKDRINKINQDLKTLQNSIVSNPNASQLKINETNLLKIQKLKQEKNELTLSISKDSFIVDHIDDSLKTKFTNNAEVISDRISYYFFDELHNLLPNVVFWENTDDYILKSEIENDLILKAKKVSDVPRSLLNIFRIALNIKKIDELQNVIKEIKQDTSERSRISDTLTTKTNEFLKKIWAEYDQEFKISLEEFKIRIEIFDPKAKGRSYYAMSERSQGAKSFLSFLFTIGAESRSNVLINTILILDEPETHLHPQGVQYMLSELIKISERNNIVIYATHSEHFIDKKNYDRHFILTKESEYTKIQMSTKGRIGYFLQEEVLYNAINIDLSKYVASSDEINFVFEGECDTIIFEKYHSIIIKHTKHLKNSVRFFQGGKCSDILKYFRKKPIQLGTKWVFILDNDSPAKELAAFLKAKYQSYMEKDIFVFHYPHKDNSEFEDLIPREDIEAVYELNFTNETDSLYEDICAGLNDDAWSFLNFKKELEKAFGNKEIFEQYLAKSKNNFNDAISSKISSITSIDSFNTYYPLYSEFANEVFVKVFDGYKPMVDKALKSAPKPTPAPKSESTAKN